MSDYTQIVPDTWTLAGIREGAVLIDFGTSIPASTRKIGADLAAKGAGMIDAPLGRTPAHAKDGLLNIMASGDQATFDKVKPVLDEQGENVFYLGALGAGHTTKLINNFMGMTTVCTMSPCMEPGISATWWVRMPAKNARAATETAGTSADIYLRTVDGGYSIDRAALDEVGARIPTTADDAWTTEEFEKIVQDWIATARHPITKRPYTEMVYQPMLELLSYLRENGFTSFIVSPCRKATPDSNRRTLPC